LINFPITQINIVMDKRHSTTGRGKKLPLAKAALVWFFEGWKNGDLTEQPDSWDWGRYGLAHEIVEIAGAKHASVNTTLCVSRALAKSKFWDKRFYRSFYRGIGNGSANIYEPNELGKRWFKNYQISNP
jgi:hypothetical protein